MRLPITYSFKNMCLSFNIGKYHKYLTCPFKTWWKARQYFKKPKFTWYFGPMFKYHGKKQSKFGEYDDYEYLGGYWPAASTEYLKWHTPKWFPIHVMSYDIGWKDKFDDPRYENPGFFIIFFGRDYRKHWQFSLVVSAPETYCCNDCTEKDIDDNYWESILWYLYYPYEYNTLNNKRNLYKARETSKNHITKSQTKKIDLFNIVLYGKETLSLGNNNNKEFTYIDIKSEQLYKYICCDYYNDKLKSITDVMIGLDGCPKKELNDEHTIGQDRYCSSQYVKIIDKETIRMYIDDNEFYNLLKSKSYSKINLSFTVHIDLGPSFKDDFLTKKGIEEIKRINKIDRKYNNEII